MQTYSCDKLQKLPREMLRSHCMEVRSQINIRKRMKKDTKDLEVYFCYIIRELENRASYEK